VYGRSLFHIPEDHKLYIHYREEFTTPYSSLVYEKLSFPNATKMRPTDDRIDDIPRLALYACCCITPQRPQACQPAQSAFRPKGLSQPTYM